MTLAMTRLGAAGLAVVTSMLPGMAAMLVACSSASSVAAAPDAASATDSGGGLDSAATDGGSEGGRLDGAADACPAGRGPNMVRLPAADGGTYCIDSTEVTQAQYAAFLVSTKGDTSGQPSYCAWNTSFIPGATPDAGFSCTVDPTTEGDHPAQCVNWCDAVAFCGWSGKHLCTSYVDVGGQPRADDEWVRACTSGGQYTWLYGNSPVEGTCADISYSDGGSSTPETLPVASLKGCQSANPSYAGVYDLLGNATEWVFLCENDPPTGDPGEVCASRGGYESVTVPCDAYTSDYGSFQGLSYPKNTGDPALGFRCCATP
jgi:formylglycine-generating enzyme required for sulfatase activity